MDINKYLDQPERACWELWGDDTFSGETYFCGLYSSNTSANRARRKHESDCKKLNQRGYEIHSG